MKKNYKALLIDVLALLFLIIVFYIITRVVSSNLKSYLAIAFLILLLVPNLMFFGFKKDKNYYLGYSVRVILTVLMISGIIIYLLGVFLGFEKGVFGLHSFVTIVIPEFILIFLWEYLRFIVIGNGYTNIRGRFFFTLLLVVFSVIIQFNPGSLIDSYSVFVFICTIVFPTIAVEFLCTYLVNNVGFRPSLLYKSISTLYIYLIPIIPALGDYLFGVIGVLVPFITFYIINKNLIVDDKYKARMNIKSLRFVTVPLIIILIILTVLVSGIFNYKLIAVASNSMQPVFSKGDGVLLEYCKPKDIKKGDILVFKHKDIVVVHRVVNINQSKGYSFNTKGDANNKKDNFIVSEKDVIGKVDFIVKYVGFPTIWINEMLRRE